MNFPFFPFLFFFFFPASLVPGYAATWDVSSRPADVGNEHVYAVHDVRNHVLYIPLSVLTAPRHPRNI